MKLFIHQIPYLEGIFIEKLYSLMIADLLYRARKKFCFRKKTAKLLCVTIPMI